MKKNYLLLKIILSITGEIDRNEYQTEKITRHKKILGKNPFIDDSSDSENEQENEHFSSENKDNTMADVPSEKLLGSRGVWRESFFFKIDDSRFKGNFKKLCLIYFIIYAIIFVFFLRC